MSENPECEELVELKEELKDLKKEEREIEGEIEQIERSEHEPFTIKVNNKAVRIVGHEHTGLQIKQAAINAGVKIQLDFVLSEELSHGRSRIIGDDQRIRIGEHSVFEAIPNDDHS